MGMRFQPNIDDAMALLGFRKVAIGASPECSPSAATDSTCSPAWSSGRSSDSDLSARSTPEPTIRFGLIQQVPVQQVPIQQVPIQQVPIQQVPVWVAPAPLQQVPPTLQQAPPMLQQVPPMLQQVPPTLQQVPPTLQQAPSPPQQAPRSAAAPPPEDAAAAPWRLVWCNEHCHKTEATAQRKRLFRATVEAGGSLLCLKKAEKVAAWVARGWCTEPWVLLTDWREAKPLLEALALQPQDRRPLCTVILADGPRQFERAAAWLQDRLPCSRGASVVRDEAAALDFVRDVVAGRADGDAQQRRSADVLETSAAVGRPAPQPEAFVEPAGTEVLSPLRRGRSAEELEELLRSAMPEHYED